MITTINNNTRVILITTSTSKQAFCNPKDYHKTLEQLDTNEGYYKVYHFWNGRQTRLSKKDLKDLAG